MTDGRSRLLIVDDHPVVRVGLRTLFERSAAFEVVGEAETAADALDKVRRERPDVVLMDVRLPDGSGVEACREIRSIHPETRVVMLTSYSDEDAVLSSIVAGAAGYLLKQMPPAQLVDSVRAVARGQSLLDPRITSIVLDRLKRDQHDVDPMTSAGLSAQERAILPLIAEGKTNREIAEVRDLSERTIKTYVSNILRKLQLSRRTEAAAFAAERRRHARSSDTDS